MAFLVSSSLHRAGCCLCHFGSNSERYAFKTHRTIRRTIFDRKILCKSNFRLSFCDAKKNCHKLCSRFFFALCFGGNSSKFLHFSLIARATNSNLVCCFHVECICILQAHSTTNFFMSFYIVGNFI